MVVVVFWRGRSGSSGLLVDHLKMATVKLQVQVGLAAGKYDLKFVEAHLNHAKKDLIQLASPASEICKHKPTSFIDENDCLWGGSPRS